MTSNHSQRRAALRTLLRADGCDALLVTDLLNVRYLTGFTGSAGALLVSATDEERTVFCTDGRYRSQSAQQVPDLRRDIDPPCAQHLGRLAATTGVGTLGFESHVLTVDLHAEVAAAAEGVQLVRAPGLVEQLRLVKDEGELELLRAACRAGDRALAELLADGGVRVGRTEVEVARDLEQRMRDAGADGPSFETIVAAGASSAVPHHRPTANVLAPGDFVKIDFGALVGGYHSDMTRTMVLGEPAAWQREIYDLVHTAQAAGCEAVRVGAEAAAVDAAARSIIVDAGYGEYFSHGLGHGVGLEIHEAPGIGPRSTGMLPAGAAVTVEPGVYLQGRGGVRIEDTLVVTGAMPELLTMTTKELLVV
ncbi:Xaa-Pro peptidase family protein [Rhodococcus sp. X156]|uniref:M24 family metallopeptidase n=1 Tax=Rhodococcus sp. X156 TaxID=2499145 RepID=UPI000FDC7FC7|nr:Xaa-Pro peptidase family protein [Rhodococcus sp. X156]